METLTLAQDARERLKPKRAEEVIILGTLVAFLNSEGNPSSMAHSLRYGVIKDTKLSTDGKCRSCLISYTAKPGDILTTVNGKKQN